MLTKNELKEVILSQREHINTFNKGTPRDKGKDLTINESFALIITGIRRCGKSTFLNQLLRKQKTGYYLNFEDPRLNDFEFSDFNKIEEIMKELYGEKGVYFFDEVQNVEQWEKFIRYLVDKKEKVLVTGSNASLLSKELGTKLTGRHLQIELFPFSFQEFLLLKKETPSYKSFEEYLNNG